MVGHEGIHVKLSEQTLQRLKQHRFVINPESMDGFKTLRTTFKELKIAHPFLSGLGIFGSRTKAAEHKYSDYDMAIFYDSSKTPKRSNDENEWRIIISTLDQNHGDGIGIDRFLWFPHEFNGQHIDISRIQTMNNLKNFVDLAKPYIEGEIDGDVIGSVACPETAEIYSRFLLCVGDDVYANRKIILDQLSNLQNGDKYFQILMQLLGDFERGYGKVPTPPLVSLPQTIAEARKYFITK